MAGRVAAGHGAAQAPQASAQRLAVWLALSELFLDTALDDADIAAIARRLQASGMPLEEIERTYEEEVAPACWRNLAAVPGGMWTGFEPAALQAAIREGLQSGAWLWRLGPLRRLQIRRWTALSRPDWRRVRSLLALPAGIPRRKGE